MPRWVFIRPCNVSPYYDPEVQEPLGLEYLSAARRNLGDPSLILDSVLDSLTDTKLARRAASFQPDIIGFSLTTAQELASVGNIHAECMRALSGRNVLWAAGGNFVSSEPGWADRLLPAGFTLVRFEGENALAELVERWRSGQVGAVGNKRHWVHGRPLENLDGACFPERPYARHILQKGWAFNLQGSRGCTGGCHHCAAAGMTGVNTNRWRGRSPSSIVAEMQHLQQRLGARAFNFIDEDFLGPVDRSPARAQAFAREIRARGVTASFGIQARPDSLSPEVIEALVPSGLCYVFTGIESDDPADLKRWGRPPLKDPWALIGYLQKAGIEVNAGVILFHPHATFEGVRRFARQLHRHRILDYQAITNRMAAMPGARLYKKALAAGQIDPGVCGQQALPFLNDGMETLYQGLLAALAPLGPPSMHALCSVPLLTTQKFLQGTYPPAYFQLKEIVHRLNDVAAQSLFHLLDSAGPDPIGKGLVKQLRRRNMAAAHQAVKQLVKGKFATSARVLEEAIAVDARPA
jgi:radical SAM superfamily enzyme YgiQ (UPF0313 family)